uniref:Pentapeptide repeat-containing protein n=1 Tax=OCS116 cluster bacterium TaxID=2030921 RepID=A0A2A4YVA7_9PROT
MANPSYIKLLRQSIKEWNSFRADNTIIPDLSFADLSGINLDGAILNYANFEGSNLSESSFKGAKLHYSNMVGVDFSNSNLEAAQLFATDMSGAVLSGVNFQGADLRNINTQSVTFHQTSVLSQNKGKRINSVDLSSVRNLTQDNLNNMLGDSLTGIPSELKRPEHWPEFDSIFMEAREFSGEEIVEILTQSAAVGGIIENGLVGAADTPINTAPLIKNTFDLSARILAQQSLVKRIIYELSEYGANIDRRVGFELKNYQDAILRDKPNWYELSDTIDSLNYIKADQEINSWNGSLLPNINRLITRNSELQLLIQPEQSLDFEIERELPKIDFESGVANVIRPILQELLNIESENIQVSLLSDSAKIFFDLETRKLDSVFNTNSYLADEVEHNKSIVLKTVKSVGGYIGTVLNSLIYTGSGIAVFGTTVGQGFLTKITAILDKIVQLFL